MNKRREVIIASAAKIIVDEGVDALTLSKVAKMANVTVPTVHNLYGKKQDLFERLAERVMSWMFEHVEENASNFFIDQMEASVERLVSRIETHELFFRAGYLVGERTGYFGRTGKPYTLASNKAIKKYEAMIENGDLAGNINPLCMAKFVNDSFRILRTDWMRGHLSLEEFRYQHLWSLYVSLMADATPNFKGVLSERLNRLNAAAGKL